MIAIAWLLFGYFYHTAIVHIVPYATDLGMTAVAAATILTVIGVTGTAGRLTLGYVADKFGNMFTTYLSCFIVGLCYIGSDIQPGYLDAVSIRDHLRLCGCLRSFTGTDYGRIFWLKRGRNYLRVCHFHLLCGSEPWGRS